MKSKVDMTQAQVAQTSHLLTASTNMKYSDLCRELIEVKLTIMTAPKLAEKKVLHL